MFHLCCTSSCNSRSFYFRWSANYLLLLSAFGRRAQCRKRRLSEVHTAIRLNNRFGVSFRCQRLPLTSINYPATVTLLRQFGLALSEAANKLTDTIFSTSSLYTMLTNKRPYIFLQVSALSCVESLMLLLPTCNWKWYVDFIHYYLISIWCFLCTQCQLTIEKLQIPMREYMLTAKEQTVSSL